jgi:hypothetical protein
MKKLGRIAAVQIPVVITTFGILALAVLGLTLAYWLLPGYRAVVTFFALACAGAASISSAFYLAASIRLETEQRQKQEETDSAKRSEDASHRRRLAAFSFMERWSDPGFFYYRKAFHEVIEAFRTAGPDAAKQVITRPDNESNVRTVLNFLEELAIAAREEHADRELLCRAFAGIVIRAYNATHPWYEEHRKRDSRPQVFQELEWLYNEWKTR